MSKIWDLRVRVKVRVRKNIIFMDKEVYNNNNLFYFCSKWKQGGYDRRASSGIDLLINKGDLKNLGGLTIKLIRHRVRGQRTFELVRLRYLN